jgi:iron complex transport system substrate-binding protein
MAPPSVASLLPAATEIIAALGAGDRLVGVSHECDHPAEVTALPRLTSTRVGPAPTSGAIDRDVRAVLSQALGVYDVELDALRAADPDVIVTQDLCDVCAVSLTVVERAVREVLRPNVRVVSLHPLRLRDVWDDVRRVALALEVEAEGERVQAELEARVAAVSARVARVARFARPRTLTIEWLDPVMIGGTWMPELVELAGGTALVTAPGEHAPTLDETALRALDPDVVLIKPCGFDLERTDAERERVEQLADLLSPARVYVADGNAYFNRPGPRLVESLEILAACLHPDELADLGRVHADAFRPV